MKKTLSILLSLCLLLTATITMPLSAYSATIESSPVAESSGTTGDCTWTLTDDGTLTISGEGEMQDYSWWNPWGEAVNKVIISDGVTHISMRAFMDCTELTSITIPDSVTSIGGLAFSGCTRLTSIHIPGSVISIGGAVFSGCTGLTSITIDENNPVYDSRDNCIAIIDTLNNALIIGCPSTVIPDSVTVIGRDAFYGCAGLTSVAIPDSVTEIGIDAFHDCTDLTSVIIPNSVINIGIRAFYGCTALTSVTIPDSVTSMGFYAFHGCSGLTSITVDENNPVYDSRNNCNAIIATNENTLLYGCQSTVIPDSVTSLESSAFADCTGLTSITIPDSVTSLGDYAFSGCTGLTSVTISNGVTDISRNAFSGCTGLTSVTIPDSVTTLGDYAFMDCTGLTSVTIPNSVTDIGYRTFSDCTGLTSVTISNGVTGIDGYAFYGCTGLTSITIPDSVTGISSNAFDRCDNLTVIYGNTGSEAEYFAKRNGFPFSALDNPPEELKPVWKLFDNGTLTIRGNGTMNDYNYNAPWDIDKVKKVIISKGITNIGASAFYDCYRLEEVILPDSITSIGKSAFQQSNITSLAIPDGVKKIGDHAFRYCYELKSITIPDSVTEIGEQAFFGCWKLSDSVTIPDSVTSIGKEAFAQCPLTSISVDENNPVYDSRDNCNAIIKTADNTLIWGYEATVIPDSVTAIGENAFSWCSDLTSITIPDSVTSIGFDAFSYCSGLTSITIPASVTSIRYAFHESENVTIYGYSGTEAERYADLDGIPFVLLDQAPTEEPTEEPTEALPDNLTWEMSDDGTLTISGEGEMADYMYSVWGGDELRDELKKVVISEGVTSIGALAFIECTELSCVVIPDTVTSIGGYAFQDCSALTDITIPESVTSIGWFTFANCTGLTSITIPDSVTSIGGYAFDGCDGLTICGKTGSEAERYANENGFTFVPLGDQPTEEPTEPAGITVLLGDADGDDSITILDATKIQRLLAGLITDDDGMITLRGDSNGDGLDILDATRIQRYLASLSIEAPIGEYVARTLAVK